ncbi:hypothetical protein LY76DRAFT_645181 [Colletotrichum caudatum]|nr:hypothetical protein LY76DRAFT_645181 [Colletotrichum caudatum]
MFTLLQTAAPETTKNTTQAFDDSNTPVHDLDDVIIVLLFSLYACFMFVLLKYIANTFFDGECDLYSVIAQQQQQRTRGAQRRRGSRRLRAEPLPAYAEQDPMEWGLLHPDAGSQSPPPAYLTIFVPDEAWMRDERGTNDDAAVLPPPYVQQGTRDYEPRIILRVARRSLRLGSGLDQMAGQLEQTHPNVDIEAAFAVSVWSLAFSKALVAENAWQSHADHFTYNGQFGSSRDGCDGSDRDSCISSSSGGTGGGTKQIPGPHMGSGRVAREVNTLSRKRKVLDAVAERWHEMTCSV